MSPAKPVKKARPARSASADPDFLKDLMFGRGPVKRFTQDSPVMPDVWLAYGENPEGRVDLLLTPHIRSSAGGLYRAVRERLDRERETAPWKALHQKEASHAAGLVYNQSTVGARLTFDELLRVVLPLSAWWKQYICDDSFKDLKRMLWEKEGQGMVAQAIVDPERDKTLLEMDLHSVTQRNLPGLLWMFRIVGALALAQESDMSLVQRPRTADPERYVPPLARRRKLVEAVGGLMRDLLPFEGEAVLYSVNRNRPASTAVHRSTLAVKADAARLLFNVSCRDLAWAVIDSGIDARHPAFRQRKPPMPTEPGGPPREQLYEKPFEGAVNRTRIVATYDFTRIRELLDPANLTREKLPPEIRSRFKEDEELERFVEEDLQDLRLHLQRGREINWDLLEPLLRVPQREGEGIYPPPSSEHGTHVAGILAGDWRAGDAGRDAKGQESLQGMCPDLRLYDFRVLDAAGQGDEFAVIAALQFLRHLNAHKDYIVVHGANLSLSIRHDVSNYACGCTPVCEECERLVGSGVVVVAAAGNLGWRKVESLDGGPAEGYSSISITDPGNTEGVITVGATHRFQPQTYGVSYFSSRGPTGDGRLKPDLVAPGEKIESTVPGGVSRPKDGTSMAAPHVSGAAALLIARHRELAGKPVRIKRILCETATDLGRERYFQGNGMVDVLRALQSI